MKLFISNGGKGGVGKSTIAIALLNYLLSFLATSKNVLVFESDTQNPDFARSVSESKHENITTVFVDLRTDDGINDFLEVLENHGSNYEYAILSLAGADIQIEKFVNLVDSLTKQLDIEIIELFTFSRTVDSINLYKKSQETGFGSIAQKSVVILNGCFGERSKFERWNDSESRQKYPHIELYIHDLLSKTYDICMSSNVTLGEMLDKSPDNFSRVMNSRLAKWLNEVNAEFSKINAYD